MKALSALSSLCGFERATSVGDHIGVGIPDIVSSSPCYSAACELQCVHVNDEADRGEVASPPVAKALADRPCPAHLKLRVEKSRCGHEAFLDKPTPTNIHPYRARHSILPVSRPRWRFFSDCYCPFFRSSLLAMPTTSSSGLTPANASTSRCTKTTG